MITLVHQGAQAITTAKAQTTIIIITIIDADLMTRGGLGSAGPFSFALTP
jgi:hypothetical protein